MSKRRVQLVIANESFSGLTVYALAPDTIQRPDCFCSGIYLFQQVRVVKSLRKSL